MVRPRAKSDVFGDSSKLPELLFEISELQGSSLRPLRRLARVKRSYASSVQPTAPLRPLRRLARVKQIRPGALKRDGLSGRFGGLPA